jgi:hypothetical protein
MPDWLFVLGGIVLLVVVLLAVDWFTAGRTKRTLVRGRDQYSTDIGVGYGVIERQVSSTQQQMPPI